MEHATTHIVGRGVQAVSSHNSKGRRLQGAATFFMSSVLCAGAAKVFRYHHASLRPAMGRPNLQVVTNAMAHRLVLDGRRAIGVEFSRGGGALQRADAAAEVIVSGGAIGSPHILQLSGIGDPDHLGRIGVDVQHALPGVGKNFQDHFIVRVTAEVKDIPTLNERSRGIRFAGELMKYAVQGRGMLTYAASLIGLR